MKFTHFKFENFKGIENQTLDLSKNPDSKVYTLVGLNESGKTTILEAINYFVYKPETLSALELDNYEVNDIHSLIPINKRDNFNGKITIEAGIELDDDDIDEIKKAFSKNDIILKDYSRKVIYTQYYTFENSKYQNRQLIWDYDFKGITGKGKKTKRLINEQALIANTIIKQRMPSILYFPNFLFEFPEKIYLSPEIDNSKYKFYQQIIQDVLDSLDNQTNIQDHLINRITSNDEKDKRNLNSLTGKMQKKLTEVIFKRWNQIFKKEISKTEILLYTGTDNSGPFIEFNIKDDVDTYRIVERSLGFRWFFVYILLTQFRTFRKKNNNVLFLFDEPASNLHPSAQTELLSSFEKLPRVLYTTHSHYLINPKWLETTFVIKNAAIDYENEADYNSKNTNIKIYKYREFAVKHPNQSNYFQPILEVLDFRPTNLELVPKVILMEGKNDFYTYEYIQSIIKKEKKKLHFIPGTSATNMETLISLYLGWGKDFIVLLDSDSEGLKQQKRYIEIFGDSIKNLVFTYEDIDIQWKNFQTEDLFTEEDRVAIQQQIDNDETDYKKKIFNRSIQELSIKNIAVKLSNNTLENFEKVLKSLKLKLNV